MEKKLVITRIRLDLLRHFKECNEHDSDVLDDKYSPDELKDTLIWLSNQKLIQPCGHLKFQLNEEGAKRLGEIESQLKKDNDKIQSQENKVIQAKKWDRILENGYKILTVPILIWTVVLQCNQAGNNTDIKKLQETIEADRTRFSITLDSLQNRIIQSDIQRYKNPSSTQRSDSTEKNI